jgi:hypothetical protein
MKTFITLLTVVASLSTLAQRGQNRRFELPMSGKQFKGQNTIFLKQELKKQFPRLNVAKWDLKRVVLVAKSKKGQGKAYLQVGRFDSRVEFIDGNRHDFQDRGYFHRIPFEAPRKDKGNWQIHLKGNVKVKKVVVVAQKNQPKRPQVTKQCGYVLETVWGKDIKKFYAKASGPKGSGVQASACQKAKKKCKAFQGEIPLTSCQKL